jgi:hypothetical protein
VYTADVYDTFGVHLNKLPAALWEAVPGSFIADWVVNIGSFLEAITPKAGTKVLGSCTVVKDTHNTSSTAEVTGHTTSGYTVVTPARSSADLQKVSKNRYLDHRVGLASRPIPFSGSLGTKRVLDSISIITQLLGSKVGPR